MLIFLLIVMFFSSFLFQCLWYSIAQSAAMCKSKHNQQKSVHKEEELQQFKYMVDELYFKYIFWYILNLLWQILFISHTTKKKRGIIMHLFSVILMVIP